MIRIPPALVLLALAACGGPPPAAAPIAGTTDRADPRPELAADEGLCCCTFDIAIPEDFGIVNTWESLASTCPTGEGMRMPGQCIDWNWCGYAPGQEPRSLADRPELAPKPPIPDTACCCDIWDGHGETFSVLEKDACALRQYSTCVAEAFCS